MSNLEEKTDSELKQMIFVLSKHDPICPQIVKELFSRSIYDYRSTHEKQDKIEFDKLTDELFKKNFPNHNYDIYLISYETFIDEISKILPDWELTIIPKDYVQSPEKYGDVTVILINKKSPKIILQCSISLEPRKSPWHLGSLENLIAKTRYTNNYHKYDKLDSLISEHFSKFFEKRKRILQ